MKREPSSPKYKPGIKVLRQTSNNKSIQLKPNPEEKKIEEPFTPKKRSISKVKILKVNRY